MVNSKEWNWKKADQKNWLLPSEESIYLADKWAHEGVHSILDLGCGLGSYSIKYQYICRNPAFLKQSKKSIQS